ncbi:MAG TPA: FAD-dependent monooxygenase [Streptosporangiaceae bacterium]|nr:FAD-dependent monooxygenase [Streptosporangiaceae bacterium]
MTYDVIVVGARVAGAATALLLARAGVRVLVVDRAGPPGDTLSSHQVQLPGVAALRRWGLLGRAVAGAPATGRLRFDAGPVVLEGRYPSAGGVSALYSPRRMVLDQVLLDAAGAAGAEVRLGFRADELLWDGRRVAGLRGRGRRGTCAAETARLVVGADGKHSFVARAAGAARYCTRPAATMASYSYWAGVPTAAGGGEIYRRPGRAVAAFPTSDDLTMIYVAAPTVEFAAARGNLEGHYLAGLDGCGDLRERAAAGFRAERLRTTPDLPARIHVPHGPGWALAGDAGLVLDPISAHGISNALRDAELLARAVVDGLGGSGGGPGGGPGGLGDGPGGLGAALAGYHRQRDAAARPMFELTARTARLGPVSRAERLLYGSLAGRPAEISRFFGALSGTEPLRPYLGLGNLTRVIAGARPRPFGGEPVPRPLAP